MAVAQFLGAMHPTRAIPIALASTTNILRDSVARNGPFPAGTGEAAGGACYQCAAWYSPAATGCPLCSHPATLTLTSASEAQASWLNLCLVNQIHILLLNFSA